MSFADDETSIEDGQPREFYEITHGATSYYIASGDRDVIYGGRTFAASPSDRGPLVIGRITGNDTFQLSLPASHPLVQRYLAAGGSPPRQIQVIARRMQLTSGEVQQIWIGYVISVAISGVIAQLAIPSRTQQSLQRKLPTIACDTLCSNVLYDNWCAVARAGFQVSTTATAVDGRSVAINDIGGHADAWAQNGELVHVPSGERMTIFDQTGKQLTLQSPIAELKSGDAVIVYAGCDHTSGPNGCQKFSNIANFAGFPQRSTVNPTISVAIGVVGSG